MSREFFENGTMSGPPLIAPEFVSSTHTEEALENNEENEKQETSIKLRTAVRDIPKHEGVDSEDTVLVSEDLGLFGVFDGMGGYSGGKEASRAAARTVRRIEFPEDLEPTSPEHNQQFLESVLAFANQEITREQQSNPNMAGMGTTATILRRFKDEQGREMAAYASVGDTRLLRIRDGKVEFLTYEEFNPKDSRDLTNCLGGSRGFHGVDSGKNDGVIELREGDRLVLLSDGISGDKMDERLRHRDYASILNPDNNPSPKEAVESLIRNSKKVDDKSAIVIDIETGDQENSSSDKERVDAESSLGEKDQEKYNQALKEHVDHFESSPPDYTMYEQWARDYIKDTFGERFLLDPESEAGQALVKARTRVATASVKMRCGSVFFNQDKRKRRFQQALTEYQHARNTYIQELYHASGIAENAGNYNKAALLARLQSMEDGALMGEEAQGYLRKENSDYQRFLEWYHGSSRKTKIVVGAGAAAATGLATTLLGGFTAGGAIAGGLAGRFVRVFVRKEASRIQSSDLPDKERNKEELATFRYSNQDMEHYGFHRLSELERGYGNRITNQNKTAVSLDQFRSMNNTVTREYIDSLKTAETDAKEKRKSVGAAALGAGLGAGIGYIIGSATDFNGLLREGGPEDRVDDLESDLKEAEERNDALELENERLENRLEAQKSQDSSTSGAETTPETAPADISENLGLPEGYLAATQDGYMATAMPGGETDSVWMAAKHSLRHHLGRPPTLIETDALQDILGTDRLAVGEKVKITQTQIARALAIANRH